jgi:polysaccharide biosynthesis/export protein
MTLNSRHPLIPLALPAFITIICLLSSCVTTKKLTYLQSEEKSKDIINSATPPPYKIMPYDNLFIRIMTPDPKLADMFNATPGTITGISITEQSADMLSYTVDADGYIKLPYAGKVMAGGKTLDMITDDVDKVLKAYIADAAVTVKLVNNYVSLVGEFQHPGKYPIYKERMNIFQALAMAGDLGDFSNRQKIQIMRQIPGGNLIKEFTLNDRSIMASDFYYVMPNDVIYAKPMKGRFFHMNEFPYTLILSVLTTFVLYWNVIQNY